MDIKKACYMIQNISCHSPAYKTVSIFDKKFSPYISIGECTVKIYNGIYKIGSKEKEQAQSKKIIGRLAHTKDPLSWGSVIVSLSVPVPWHYRRRHARRQ